MVLRRFSRFVLLLSLVTAASASAQTAEPAITFRAGVELVSVTAVVRDKKGHVVRALTPKDFVVVDGGQPRKIVSLHADETAPASIAFLVDGSGSMRVGTSLDSSKTICNWLLTTLDQKRDDAALFTFDTRLITLRDFTGSLDHVRSGLNELEQFGATSIYDAIAGASAIVAERARNRRAVIVLTDGSDNASQYSPQEVAWIASTIDVPVYVFAVGGIPTPDNPELNVMLTQTSPLAELARATGGDFFVANSPALAVSGITRLVDELRHQYLIAFEPGHTQGLRKIEIRTQKTDLKVSSRKWYTSGSGE